MKFNKKSPAFENLLTKRFISRLLQFLMHVKIDLTLNHGETKAFKTVTM